MLREQSHPNHDWLDYRVDYFTPQTHTSCPLWILESANNNLTDTLFPQTGGQYLYIVFILYLSIINFVVFGLLLEHKHIFCVQGLHAYHEIRFFVEVIPVKHETKDIGFLS